MDKPGRPWCHACAGRGTVECYPLCPRPGDPDPLTIPCPFCFPDNPPLDPPEEDIPPGRILTIIYPNTNPPTHLPCPPN